MSPATCPQNRDATSRTRTTKRKSRIRADKVLAIRRRLGQGRYEITDKLNVVIDKLLDELLR